MKALLLVALVSVAGTAVAQQPQMKNGYVRKDGVYVPPSLTTKPNDTKLDNYSTRGNVNPMTGRAGTVDPYAPPKPRQR